MSSQISLSMNSSRPYESFVEKQNVNKENNNNNNNSEKEKEEKLKELLEKNERLEKECLKFQIQVKSLEDKLQTIKEKEYKSQNNTSSNFLLPSEFRKVWEDFGKESVGDIFVDFFDDFILTLHLFQEIMLISHTHFKEELKNLTNKIMKMLEIKNINKSYSFIEKNIKPIILEYYEDIFENEIKSDFFYQKIKEDYAKFINENFLNEENKENCNKKLRQLMKIDKTDELRELLRSKYVKDFLKTVKKIFLFIEFHEPQLSLKLESFEKRMLVVKEMKQTDCVLADGYIKDVKNTLILLDPPLLKNGYPYSGLKPIALICPDDFKFAEENNNVVNVINEDGQIGELLVAAAKPNKHETDLIENNLISGEANKSNFNDDKDFSIPLRKEEKLGICNRSKLSDIEKKEKIIQMILDNDKEKESSYNNNANNSSSLIESANLNRVSAVAADKKNDYLNFQTSGNNNKNLDVAFSRNPNTSSSKNFSRNDSKNYIRSIVSEAEKPTNYENKQLEKSSKGSQVENFQEEKTFLHSYRERNINSERNNLIPTMKSSTNSSRNLIINSNPFTNNSSNLNNININIKNKSNLNNIINISANSDLKTGNSISNNNINNSFNKNNNNNNNNNTSNYSISSNNNNIQNNNEINNNNKSLNKPNIIKISKGFNNENNFPNKINIKELSSPLLKISENSQSVKNLSLNPNNSLTRNQQYDSKAKLYQENSKTIISDRKEINMKNPNNSFNLNHNIDKLQSYKAPKECSIKGINVINITNKIEENENLNNSNNNLLRNSNDSFRNTSNEIALKTGYLSKTNSKNMLEKPVQILNNVINNYKNLNPSGNLNIQSVQQLKVNLNKTEDLKIQAKTSPVHKGNAISTKNAYVTSIDLSKKQNNNQNSQSKEIKKIIEAFNNNNFNNNNLSSKNLNQNQNQQQLHKILVKKKPHEVQLTLTNQNFNFISSNINDLHYEEAPSTKNKVTENNPKIEYKDFPSGDFKKIKTQAGKQASKKIRISELSQNNIESKSNSSCYNKHNNNNNNRSYASNSTSYVKKDKFPKTRSTSEHQLSSKVIDLHTHSYSYSHINVNRLNILSAKKSGSNSASVNDSCSRITKKRKSDGSCNLFINNNFKNYNNNLKEQANKISSSSSNNINNKEDFNFANKISNTNLYEIKSDSTKLSNKQNNYYNHIKFNRDSYKNRYVYLNSNHNSNSKSKSNNYNNNNNYNFGSNTDKGRINLLNKNPSTGKISNAMISSGKNDRYSNSSNNYFNNVSSSNNNYNHIKKIYSKNNSNDFNYININQHNNNNNFLISSNLNKTNSKTNFFNTSKEKDNFTINTNNDQKEKFSTGTGAFSIRSYTNDYKKNISKKEKTLLNSKEKILNINKIYKNRNNNNNNNNNNKNNNYHEGLEIPSSRTHANLDSAEITKYEKSPPLDIQKTSKLQINLKAKNLYNNNYINTNSYNNNDDLDAEKEIVFNDHYDNPHLETEGDEAEFNKESQKNFFSDSFTFKKEKKKLSLSCEKPKVSQKNLQLGLLKTKKPKGNASQSRDRLSNNTQQNTLNNENKSTITDYSNVQTKRDSFRSNFKKNSVKNKKKPQVLISNNLSNNNNNIINNILLSAKNKILCSKNIYELNNSKNNVNNNNNNNFENTNEIYLNTNSSENPTAVLTSNFIAKSNLSSNSKNVITSNRNDSKTKTFIEKKLNNISSHQTNTANLNLTKEKIFDCNNLNYNNNNINFNIPAQINHPMHTPNHNYNKSTHTHLSYFTTAKNINVNNDKVANKITQILSMQNKKSASIKRNQSRTPNNNAKNHSSKLKGFSPKVKGITNLNNESISNSIVNNTNVPINLHLKDFDNNGNLFNEKANKNNNNNKNTNYNFNNNEDLNASIERNILVTQNSTDSKEKSIINNNLIKNEEFEVLSSANYRNKSKNNNNLNNTNNPNAHLKNYNPGTLNKNNNNNNTNSNVYSTIKKISNQDPEELNINRTLNSINNSKSKEKKQRYNLNFNKYHHITKEKLKFMKKDKFVKYPTLKERTNNDYMLLKDEFSYYENIEINNNSINIPANKLIQNNKNYQNHYEANNKIYNKSNPNNNINLSKKSDFNYNNNYIHTTDDEEIIEYNDHDSKIINHEMNFLNENFNENSADFTNEDLKTINYSNFNSDKKSKSNFTYNEKNTFNNSNNKHKTFYAIQSESQEYNSPNMLIDEKDFEQENQNVNTNTNYDNNNENEYEEQFLETNNSIATVNLGAAANNTKKDFNSNNTFANKNTKSINALKHLAKISPVQKETIETCDGVYFANETNQNMKISDFNLNSNYKSSNLENTGLQNQAALSGNFLNTKKTQKSNSRSNYIKENLSGNSNNSNNYNNNNVNTEASGNNFNKTAEKHIKNAAFNENQQHNNKDKYASKNSNHIKNNNSKEIFVINSGKKISPSFDRKIYESNLGSNKPNNLNLKFNFIDLASKNSGNNYNKKINAGQFINTNTSSKEKLNDKPKHNFININYTK